MCIQERMARYSPETKWHHLVAWLYCVSIYVHACVVIVSWSYGSITVTTTSSCATVHDYACIVLHVCKAVCNLTPGNLSLASAPLICGRKPIPFGELAPASYDWPNGDDVLECACSAEQNDIAYHNRLPFGYWCICVELCGCGCLLASPTGRSKHLPGPNRPAQLYKSSSCRSHSSNL